MLPYPDPNDPNDPQYSLILSHAQEWLQKNFYYKIQ